ncbi:hypothetical protein [Pseudonocardia spinosispora]|uniref:hypothetical protein n=1 Tax=Pseudonocardia spinosispora TaxID=103441 RepID=UPI0004130D25|nr:hypothetical protein [Pseudonocardia spinosispora]
MSAEQPHHELDAYLDRLRTELGPGTGSEVTDLIDECRDHVLSHAEESVAHGGSPRSAMVEALSDFGAASSVGPVMRGELRRRPLRRLSAALLAAGAVLGAGWHCVIAFGPPAPWTDEARPLRIEAIRVVGHVSTLVAVVLALASLALLTVPGRLNAYSTARSLCQGLAMRACVISVVLGVVAATQVAAYLLSRGTVRPESLAWPAVWAAVGLTVAGVPVVLRPLRTVVALR